MRGKNIISLTKLIQNTHQQVCVGFNSEVTKLLQLNYLTLHFT